MAAPQRVRAALARTTRLAPHTFLLGFAGCECLIGAAPGQFVMLRGEDWGTDPLLGRAFSILGVSPDGVLDVLVKAVGKASTRMARAPVGAGYDVLGPLGSGYMSDPVTQEFLKRHYEKFPEIFRKSWKPYKKTLDGKNQKSLGEF